MTPGLWKINAIARGPQGKRIIGGADTPGADEYLINNHHATVATVYRARDARAIAGLPELLDAAEAVCVRLELETCTTAEPFPARAAVPTLRAALDACRRVP